MNPSKRRWADTFQRNMFNLKFRSFQRKFVEALDRQGRTYYLQENDNGHHGGQAGNIDIIDARGIITHRACVHPSIYVPDPDAMLGQKLRLEHDDVELIRIANRSPVGAEAPVLPALQ